MSCARSPGLSVSSISSKKSAHGAGCIGCPARPDLRSIDAPKRSAGLKVHRHGVAAPDNTDPRISSGSRRALRVLGKPRRGAPYGTHRSSRRSTSEKFGAAEHDGWLQGWRRVVSARSRR